MAGMEARSLQKMFNVEKKPDLTQIPQLLAKSSWALDQPFKTVELDKIRAVLTMKDAEHKKQG